jgi:apolipoprotein N-acyltransferase
MNKINGKLFASLVGIVCWMIAAWIGLLMLDAANQQELWKSEALWFWLFIWSGTLLLTGRFITTLSNKFKLLGASLLSGILLAGGFMPMPTFFLMFVGFVPLLWVENEIATARENTSKWTVFKFAFCSFFTWNLLSTWWIQNSAFAAGIFSNMLNAVFMTIPFVIYHITHKVMGRRAANWGFLGYWLTFEIGHLTWDLSWPWLTLGNSFAHLPAIVQWYEYTGVFGGSLWILGVNLYLFQLLFDKYKGSTNTRQVAFAITGRITALIVLPIILSLAMYYSYTIDTNNLVEIVSVQPNYEPHHEKFSVSQSKQLERYKRITTDFVTPNTDYLIFPETAFRRIQSDQLATHSTIQTLQELIKPYPKLNLVTGISAFKEYQENDELKPDNLYTYCNTDKTKCRYIDSHNAAIQLNNQTTEIPYYKKSKLVPGAESMPFIGGISFFQDLVLDLGGSPGVGLGTQLEREVFTSDRATIAPLICYESIYGDYVTEYVQRGANILFVITNDGWWGNTIGHRQHLYLSSLRAIETRRTVVRSANTGISCIINRRGDIEKATNYNEQTAVKATVPLNEEITFYTRYGDLIGRVSILLSGWLIITLIANTLQKSKR